MANDRLVVSFWFAKQRLEDATAYINRFLSSCNRWTIGKHGNVDRQNDLMFICPYFDEAMIRTAILFKPKMVLFADKPKTVLFADYYCGYFDEYQRCAEKCLTLYVRKDLHYADEIDETSPNYAPSKNVLNGCCNIKQDNYDLDIETLSCRLADLLDAEDLYEKKKRKNQDVTVEA